MDYNSIIDLIKRHPDTAEFGEFGDGTSVERIQQAEVAIGLPLPDSYKWWLRNYGGGEIGGEEIYSIYSQQLDHLPGGDVVKMFRLYGKRDGKIPICHSDIDGFFCFDTCHITSPGEYGVFSGAIQGIYAANFLDFLEKRILINL